ncbi:hypothetical protein PENDEC_c016G02687 [Penicillium decumbens]|uniref:Uncharacterized protein n=1 Tax=Penicillium decumbens TaxID=69771 RepID=A0A1V6P8E3_PENDC|nr:hypothetical protein PENDEC_c016G02687 [Penicillium decumbens]
MANRTPPLLVFVGRISILPEPLVNRALARLHESLEFVEREHHASHANDGWRPASTPMQFIEEIIADAQCAQSPVILVISGWTGLTTNFLTFDKIFARFESAGVDVQLRIYAGNPRQWFDVNPQQVRAVHDRTIDLEEDDDVELDDSTELFIENFSLMHAAYALMSGEVQEPIETDLQRHMHPGWDYTSSET